MLAVEPSSRPSAAELQDWTPSTVGASPDAEHAARMGALSLGANRPSGAGSASACGGGSDPRALDSLFGRARSVSSNGAKEAKRKAADAKPARRKEAPKAATLQMTSLL